MIVAPNKHRSIRASATRMGGARMGQEQIVRAMGTAILRGDYPEGGLLPAEGDLMAQFGISRTVLREVMKTLAAKGLVVSKTRVGTKVRAQVDWNMFDTDLLGWRLDLGMDIRFLNSLYEIRLAVEPAATALAALRRSEESLARMRALIDEFRQPGHTRLSFAEIDLALHLEIAAASGNPFMRAIGAIIEAALMATFVDSAPVADQDRLHHSTEDHAEIVEAIAAGDATRAAQAMTQVIEDGRRNRTKLLGQAQPAHN
ncbi:FadR/GntR family transcriptional regulator [Dongia sp.]|uniref:FadR/GntR family transcriptional regulator n=1 Tax=Dongia sp. TaxID=1977262 RepID=UPI0035B09A0F